MNDKYDHFELEISLTGPHDQDDALTPQVYVITQAVLINGENLAPKNPIDLCELAKSCQLPGEFYIVTCGCGDAGCAGIEDGIWVSHLSDSITWEVPEPISAGGLSEEDYERYHNKRTFRRFRFDPAAYLSAVQAGLREARHMLFGEHQPVECSPYGFDPDDLLDLDPIVFSERGAVQGCTIVGRKICIDRTPGRISINRIGYHLSELPVPESIKSLDDWSAWEPKPCGDGFCYNYVAAPGWEVHRRMKLLANYLAEITQHEGEIVVTLRENRKSQCKHQLVLGGNAR
jgi:hypothetical protein